MRRGVPPYLLPDTAAVSCGPWNMQRDTGTVGLPPVLPDWDYGTDLKLTREVRVDVERLAREAALPAGAPFWITVEWAATASQTSGRACRSAVHRAHPTTLSLHLAGELLGGDLELVTRLVLADDVAGQESFVACHVGDVLFEEAARVRLQGTAGRLPTYVVDFSEAGFDRDARWHVELPVALDAPANSAVSLYLNSSDGELVKAATNADSPTPFQRRLLDWMETDLAIRIVEAALRPEWCESIPDYIDEPDTIGAAMAALLNVLFPGESPAELAALRDGEPGRFHSRLQGSLRRMRDARDDVVSSLT